MTCGEIDFKCTRCRLSRGRTQVVPGVGRCDSPIAFLGEAPGRDEDLKGEPFVGRGGKILDQALKEAGISRSQVFICNLVKCRPPKNRRPRKDEIETCSMFLRSELGTVRPSVVCVLGQTAANSILHNKLSMSDLICRNWTTEIGERKMKVVVAYHPAACLYQKRNLGAFKKSIRASLESAGML